MRHHGPKVRYWDKDAKKWVTVNLDDDTVVQVLLPPQQVSVAWPDLPALTVNVSADLVTVTRRDGRQLFMLDFGNLFLRHEFPRRELERQEEEMTPRDDRLTSYHFDCGNSTDGPVGFCARVRARTREEALEVLREALPHDVPIQTDSGNPAVEYLNVYFNPDGVSTIDSNSDSDEAVDEGDLDAARPAEPDPPGEAP